MSKAIKTRIEEEIQGLNESGRLGLIEFHRLKAKRDTSDAAVRAKHGIQLLQERAEVLRWVLHMMEEEEAGVIGPPKIPEWTMANIMKAMVEGEFSKVFIERLLAPFGTKEIRISIFDIGRGGWTGESRLHERQLYEAIYPDHLVSERFDSALTTKAR